MSLEEPVRAAVAGWVTRSRAALGDRVVSTRIYEGRQLVAEVNGAEASAVVESLADVSALAGKTWSGRVALCEVSGAELLSVPVRIERAVVAVSPVPEAESTKDAYRAISEALKHSTMHAHAAMSLTLQTVKNFGEAATAMMNAQERALATMVDRAQRAEAEATKAKDLLTSTLEAAGEIGKQAEKYKADAEDVTAIVRAIAEPKIKEIVAQVAMQAAQLGQGANGAKEGMDPS